jgi:hypothetical protein
MLKSVDCPYCGEGFETAIEIADGSQDYIEDCPVCCRPIEFHIECGIDKDMVSVIVRRDDD